jgi:hypothetical protein
MDDRTPIERIVELRCTVYALRGSALALDAVLVEPGADGDRTVVLCHGAEVWAAGDDPDFPVDARLWMLKGESSPGHPHPGLLPASEAALLWGDHLAGCLEAGVGPQVLNHILDELPREEGVHVRVVVRALDPISARLPFETLVWPREKRSTPLAGRSISILRTADGLASAASVAAPGLASRDPGRYQPALLAAAGGPSGRVDPERLKQILGAFAAQGDHGSIAALPSLPDFAGDWSTVRDELAHTDLLVVCGHGQQDAGLEVGEGNVDGRALATEIGRHPSAVVLAMCGSAMSMRPSVASPVLELARQGVAIAIGFQGYEVLTDHFADFVRGLTECMQAPLLAACDNPRRGVSLLDWEQAIIAGRQAIHGATAAPVVYVHPALLVANQGRNAGMPRRSLLRTRDFIGGKLLATPWYVPGQIACVQQDGRGVRLPLPVDTGVQAHVELWGEGHHAVVAPAGYAAIDDDDVAAVASAWDLHDRVRITVTLSLRPGTKRWISGWANRSAELSALIRAVAHITRIPPTGAVLDLLDEAVRLDWGAHDASARPVDIATGRRLPGLGRWPAIEVDWKKFQRVGSLPDQLQSLRKTPPLVDWPLVHLAQKGKLDPRALRNLLRAQRMSACANRTTPLSLRTVAGDAKDMVVVPAVARVRILDEDSTRGSGPRLTGVGAPAGGGAPEVLS